jgi:hypothetical protein
LSATMTGMGVGSTKKQIAWRRNKVLDLMAKGIIDTSRLSLMMRVSESTIKRDRVAIIKETNKNASWRGHQMISAYALTSAGIYRNLEVATEIRDNDKNDPNTRLQAIYCISKLHLIIDKFIGESSHALAVYQREIDHEKMLRQIHPKR